MGRETERFNFEKDTFAFVNETVWRYSVDPKTGKQVTETQDPLPDFTLRCFGLVRAAKLFFYNAQFRPDEPKLEETAYATRVRRVMDCDPRSNKRAAKPIEIPGYASVREFSAARESMLKRELPGVWRSYFQRGNWRMVLPVTRGHQRNAADEICCSLRGGVPTGIHVFTFPQLTINHAVLAWAAEEEDGRVTIKTYDPNIADASLELSFDRKENRFHLPATHYFKGGPVKAYGVYRNLIY